MAELHGPAPAAEATVTPAVPASSVITIPRRAAAVSRRLAHLPQAIDPGTGEIAEHAVGKVPLVGIVVLYRAAFLDRIPVTYLRRQHAALRRHCRRKRRNEIELPKQEIVIPRDLLVMDHLHRDLPDPAQHLADLDAGFGHVLEQGGGIGAVESAGSVS